VTSTDNPAISDVVGHVDLFDPNSRLRRLRCSPMPASTAPLLRTDADAGYYIAARYEDVRSMAVDTDAFAPSRRACAGSPSRCRR